MLIYRRRRRRTVWEMRKLLLVSVRRKKEENYTNKNEFLSLFFEYYQGYMYTRCFYSCDRGHNNEQKSFVR